jgi:hypothetical protein
MILPLFFIATSASALLSSNASTLNGTISNGIFTLAGFPDREIGFSFSAINAIVSEYFSPVVRMNASNGSSLMNSASGYYSYLTLSNGTYVADEPLTLLPQLVLVLDRVVMTHAADFDRGWGGLIELNGTDYAGVVSPGGPDSAQFLCTNASMSPAAVRVTESSYVYVDGIGVDGCGHTEGGGIHYQGTPKFWGATHSGGTITNCRVCNSQRGIWLEQMIRTNVVHNELFNNFKHTLDFDAFTMDCVATGNRIYNNTQEAIFIEQASSGHVITGNTLGPSNYNGVAVFNNDLNITCGPHFIVDNEIFGNTGTGISVGSTSPKLGQPDIKITVVGNRIHGNGGDKPQGIHTNGAQQETTYSCNENLDGVSMYSQKLGTQRNISFLDPLDREIPLKY